MAVTIQQIAEQAGVSRGTVDRALNHRGRINPEVAERICRLADEMGYVQKERKHSRTAKDKRLKIGVVTQLARSSFMQEVNRGIEKAAVELKEKGIQLILKEGLSVDEEEQLQESEKAYADHKITDEQIQGKRWIIKQSQQKEAAFSMFYEQYKNLDEDAWIVSQSAFDNLMMKNEAGMIVNIVLMVIIVLSASSCMTRNFKNKSVFLIRSTERGAAATFVGQSVCVLITSFVLCVFQMYLKCRNIENAFLFEGWNAPVYSISKLKDFPFSLNIQQYLILITLLQTICVCACGMLLLSLSVWIRQFQRTFLVGMLIFISPLILKMVGRMPEQSLFADHIFDMERILDKGGDLTFFAIYACAVLLMSLLCLFLAWKRFQVDR